MASFYKSWSQPPPPAGAHRLGKNRVGWVMYQAINPMRIQILSREWLPARAEQEGVLSRSPVPVPPQLETLVKSPEVYRSMEVSTGSWRDHSLVLLKVRSKPVQNKHETVSFSYLSWFINRLANNPGLFGPGTSIFLIILNRYFMNKARFIFKCRGWTVIWLVNSIFDWIWLIVLWLMSRSFVAVDF